MRKQASKIKPIKSIKSSYHTFVNIDVVLLFETNFLGQTQLLALSKFLLYQKLHDTHRLVALATSQWE